MIAGLRPADVSPSTHQITGTPTDATIGQPYSFTFGGPSSLSLDAASAAILADYAIVLAGNTLSSASVVQP
ncbi:MAG: hypothetical protein WC803_12640 [Sphingomonas sp.]|jgi:hypothetical protein